MTRNHAHRPQSDSLTPAAVLGIVLAVLLIWATVAGMLTFGDVR